MTGVLKHTLVVRDPETNGPVALLAGEAVPSWASDLVHPDDVEGGEAKRPAAKRATKQD